MKPAWQATLLAAVSSALLITYQAVLVATRSDQLFDGYRFQAWSGDSMMQTVEINDLLQVGPVGLWYLHVQPPMLDAMRFLLALPEYLTGTEISTQAMDQRQYLVHALLYGVVNALVFAWTYSITQRVGWAWIAGIAWAAYPGNIAMATLLDGTYLSLTFITAMLYLLFLAIRTSSSSLLNWSLVILLLASWTRTIFQIHVLILFVIAVIALLIRLPRKSGLSLALTATLTVSLFVLPAKQQAMFGSPSTTSFAGAELVEKVSLRLDPELISQQPVPTNALENARVFESDLNTEAMVRENLQLLSAGTDWYLANPWQAFKNLLWAVQINSDWALKSTAHYSPNRLTESLPWQWPSDETLNAFIYIGVLIAIAALAVLRLDRAQFGSLMRRYWPLLLVIAGMAATILLANRYDYSEANRLKIFLMPVGLVTLMWLLSLGRHHGVEAESSAASESPASR